MPVIVIIFIVLFISTSPFLSTLKGFNCHVSSIIQILIVIYFELTEAKRKFNLFLLFVASVRASEILASYFNTSMSESSVF